MKKVSIIVPVYNVEKYIEKCLNSLVKQTLKEIEIIVVNDGSPDNSQVIIDKFVKKYPTKVKSYIKTNGGLGDARNYGIKKATGDYIGFVDSDDYVELEMYEKLYNKAIQDDLDIVICDNYNIYENSNKKVEDIEFKKYDDNKINAFFGKNAVWNKLFKKSLIKDINFRSKIWYEDFDYTFKAITKTDRIDYVSGAYYNYLIREGSIMNNSNIQRNLEILLAFDEVKKYNEYNSIIEYLAIEHIFVAAIVRVIISKVDKKEKKLVINELRNYVEKNFPQYKNNKYLNNLPKNKRVVYHLISNKFYFLVALIFKIKRS